MKTSLLKITNVLATLICCFAFAACNEDDLSSDRNSSSLVTRASVYMQDFTPAGNESVGSEVMLTDKRDGNVYRCIKMADGRWWMGENLRGQFGSYVEGNPTKTYGLMYDWDSAQDYVPEGWSLPTNAEWKILADSLGGADVAGGKMKSVSGWYSDGNGTNSSGFNGLPGGWFEGVHYLSSSTYGFWWSAESFNSWALFYRSIALAGPLTRGSYIRHSVRCILDEPLYVQTFVPSPADTIGTEVILVDRRDGTLYRCVKAVDGRWWMGENLKYNIAGSIIYNNDPVNLETYGRLYEWQDAINAAPENWSVPSDDEWKALEIALGMSVSDANADNWRNSGNVGTQLKQGGNSKIDLLLGGYWDPGATCYFLGTNGFYWTSTANDSSYAWFRDISNNDKGVDRSPYGMFGFSVRCILNQ